MKKIMILSIIILIWFASVPAEKVKSEGSNEPDTWMICEVISKNFELGSAGGFCSPNINAKYVVFVQSDSGRVYALYHELIYGSTEKGDRIELGWRRRGYSDSGKIYAQQIGSWKLLQ